MMTFLRLQSFRLDHIRTRAVCTIYRSSPLAPAPCIRPNVVRPNVVRHQVPKPTTVTAKSAAGMGRGFTLPVVAQPALAGPNMNSRLVLRAPVQALRPALTLSAVRAEAPSTSGAMTSLLSKAASLMATTPVTTALKTVANFIFDLFTKRSSVAASLVGKLALDRLKTAYGTGKPYKRIRNRLILFAALLVFVYSIASAIPGLVSDAVRGIFSSTRTTSQQELEQDKQTAANARGRRND